MDNGILSQFNIPEVALNGIAKARLSMQDRGDGLAILSAEHNGGVAHSFFTFADYDWFGSKIAKYEKFNNLDCIKWSMEDGDQFVARVMDLPDGLLEFEILGYHGEEDSKHIPGWKTVQPSADPLRAPIDPYAHPIYGDCIGGLLKESYDRFKEGLEAPGLPLSKWGQLDDSEVATLVKYGVFSVEQFAAKPPHFVKNGRFPQTFHVAYDRAIQYVAAKDVRAKDDELAEQLKSFAQALSAEQAEKSMLAERLMKLESMMVAQSNTSSVLPDTAPVTKKNLEQEKENNRGIKKT